jgi:mRNA interferase MazF
VGKFIKGDVVVLPFPFSDLSTSKRRPALVLVDLKGNDLILCQITSKTFSDDLAVLIEVTDIENGTLNTVSNVRSNKLFTAHENIVLYKVGTLKTEKLDIVVSKIIDMLQK